MYTTQTGRQVIGFGYFSSLANDIPIEIEDKCKDEIGNRKGDLVLYKNDILHIKDTKNKTVEYFIFNGGGNIADSKNKIELKKINTTTQKRVFATLNKDKIVSLATIDFFGNIKVIQ